MRKVAIFVISLPLLALAILWVPCGLALIVFAGPLWLMLATIDWLRGNGFDMYGLLFAPLMVVRYVS